MGLENEYKTINDFYFNLQLMIKQAIIVGAFHEIIELAEELKIKILGLIDNEKIGYYRNYPILCNDANASQLPLNYLLVPLIIAPDKPAVRYFLNNKYEDLGFSCISLISKSAKISKSAIIENGTIIQYGVNISSEANIGKFTKLNTACNIMHNVTIGDFTTIAPNAVILGNVRIGRFCYIGSNSTILPNVEICDGVIIGAGSVVTKTITQPGTYMGVPALMTLKKYAL